MEAKFDNIPHMLTDLKEKQETAKEERAKDREDWKEMRK
jgi:hypothetical protein